MPGPCRLQGVNIKGVGLRPLGFLHLSSCPTAGGGGCGPRLAAVAWLRTGPWTVLLCGWCEEGVGWDHSPWLHAACFCGGMSGMFGIRVFTSQGAHGSLVLECGSSIGMWEGLSWAWLVAGGRGLDLETAGLAHPALFSRQLSFCASSTKEGG